MIAERLLVEQLEHGRRRAVRLEGDLALLRVWAEVGDVEAAVAERELLPRDGTTILPCGMSTDKLGAADSVNLASPGQHRRHLVHIGDAQPGEDRARRRSRLRRELGTGFDLGELAGRKIDLELAAEHLSRRAPARSTQSRALPARNFGQNRLSVSIGIGLSSPARCTSGEPGASCDAAGEARSRRVPERMTKREMVTRPSCGAIVPVDLPFVDLHRREPELLDREHRLIGLEVKFQDVGVPLASRTGRNSPLIVALLCPQVSVEGSISTTSFSLR